MAMKGARAGVAAGAVTGSLEDRVQAFHAGVRIGRVPALDDPVDLLADAFHRVGERLDDVEAVDRLAGILEGLADRLLEGAGHVADHLCDGAAATAVGLQEAPKLPDAVLAPAWQTAPARPCGRGR